MSWRDRRSTRSIRTGAISCLFYEYFHGETGRGCGASHQTGWTALAVKLLENTIEHTDQSIQIDREPDANASKVRGAAGAKRRRSASRPAVAV